MITKGMMTSNSNEWATPKGLFDELNNEFHFTLDPCATPENAKCRKFFTAEDNGLLKDWSNEIVFCNPPYGRAIKDWVEKAYKEAEGGQPLYCLFLHELTHLIFISLYTKSTKLGLSQVDCISMKASNQHHFQV